MAGEGKVIASGCAAIIGALVLWVAAIAFLVWLIATIVTAVVS